LVEIEAISFKKINHAFYSWLEAIPTYSSKQCERHLAAIIKDKGKK